MRELRAEIPVRLGQLEMLEGGMVVVGLAFAAYFLFAWLSMPTWTHFDVLIIGPKYMLQPGESFLSGFMRHVFNLRITEGGFYRPRFVSFLIDYIDMNVLRALHSLFPQLGIKLPSYALSIVATVAAFVWFWRSLFPGSGYGLALIAGASLLYCDVYMNTSFMALRGGKFLNSAAGLFCLALFIRNMRRDFSLRDAGRCLAISCAPFLLMAMDEQMTAFVAFIAGVAAVVSLLRWRVTRAAAIFACAVAQFALFYFGWGRWLFARYTPDGINEAAHYHQFSDVFRVGSTQVSQAVEMLMANITALGIASVILAAVLGVSAARIVYRAEERFQRFFVCAAFTLFPFMLTSIMVASHGDIYLIKALWTLFYFALPMHVLIAAVAMSSSFAEYRTDWAKIALAVAFLWICASGVYRMNDLRRVSCEQTLRVIIELPTWPMFACGKDPVFQ